MLGFVGVLAVAGCAAKGEVVPINLIPVVQSSSQKPDAVVVVLPFEDGRAEPNTLGSRKHFWAASPILKFPEDYPATPSRRP